MKQLSPEALDVLSSGVAIHGNALTITGGQLDRKLYLEVNAALEALGGKWNRKAKMHLFDEDPADALEQVLLDGAFTDKKRDFQQFFTPAPLAKKIVANADVKDKHCLEPSAGGGALAHEMLVQGAASVIAIELDERCSRSLLGLSDAHRSAGETLIVRSSENFLGVTPEHIQVDRVVMNPPFAKQQDIDHVAHAYAMLAPKGSLVAIMAAGVKFRSDKKTKAFHDLVERARGTIEDLPEAAFAESGTNVRTVLVRLKKQ